MTVLAVDVGRTTFRAAVFSNGVRGVFVRLDNGATLADDDGIPRLLGLLEMALRAPDRLPAGHRCPSRGGLSYLGTHEPEKVWNELVAALTGRRA